MGAQTLTEYYTSVAMPILGVTCHRLALSQLSSSTFQMPNLKNYSCIRIKNMVRYLKVRK